MDRPLASPRARRPEQLAAQLERNAVDALPAGGLEAKLAAAEKPGRPLRVKLGIDPTAPDIHLGHTVVLGKAARVPGRRPHRGADHRRLHGPRRRSLAAARRPARSCLPKQIDANAATFQEQAFKVLDADRVEVRRNTEWLDMSMIELFALMRMPTVAQLLERDDFAKRYVANAADRAARAALSAAAGLRLGRRKVQSDVELGGTDQKFNLLLGRDIQTAYGSRQQAVLTLPILPGIDGVRRMGKSLGNHIGVTEPPEEIFGKMMSIPDDVMPLYYDLLLGS